MVHLVRIFCWVTFALIATAGVAQSSNPVGNAYAQGDNCYVVTNSQEWQLGAVWFNESLDLTEPFEITLEMYLGFSNGGADGLVFVFQQVGTDALGEPGGGIGFAGFSPSLGIELDTFQNTDFGDPYDDHMAMLLHGSVDHNGAFNVAGPVDISATQINVEDNQDHVFELHWDPETVTLDVYFDCELRLSQNIDLVDFVFDGDPIVWWGFTGATGGNFNVQSVCISEFALGLQDEYNVCLGESIELGVAADGDGTFSWEPSETLNDPNIQNPIATPEETTTYTVTFTDLCGETISEETTVYVTDVQVSLEDQYSGCEGEELTIQAQGNGEEYTWSNGDEGDQTTASDEGVLEVTAIAEGCETTATTEVIFFPPPSDSSLEDEYTGCDGDIIDLNATATNGDLYNWSNGDDGAEILVGQSGVYTVTVTSENGCSANFSTEVVLVDYPSAILPETVEACEGNSVSLQAGEAQSWIWSTGGLEQSISVSEAGGYQVVLSNGDCSITDSVEVLFYDDPEFSWVSEVTYCNDTSIWLVLPDLDYEWYWQGLETSDSVQLVLEGFYELTAIDNQSGCEFSQFTFADVLAPPSLQLPELGVLCDGQPLEITASTDEQENAMWEDGSEGHELTVYVPGDYTVTTFNDCGEATAVITVIEDRCSCEHFVPNIFTPDMDGINEVFIPVVNCEVEDYVFAIFNRWGEKIFHTNEPGVGWNGAGPDRSHFVQNDVYLWQLQYQVMLYDGVKQVDQTGFVVVGR